MRRPPLAAAAGLALSLLASPSLACWDGYTAASSRVSLARASEDLRWRPEQARALALALARLEVLVPAGYALRADPSGALALCPEDEAWGPCLDHTSSWQGGDLDTLVGLVADLVQADRATRQRARAIRGVPVYTVQIAASAGEAGAQAVAAQLNDREQEAHHGFLEQGGFPARNDWAHVVPASLRPGRRVYRVWAGAFLDRRDAEAVAREVARRTGVVPFVRVM